MEIHQYVIEFMMRDSNGNINVVQNAYIAASSPKRAVEKFNDLFKNDTRVEGIRDVLMICEGWR